MKVPVLLFSSHFPSFTTQGSDFSSIPLSRGRRLFPIFRLGPNSGVPYTLCISRGDDFGSLMKHHFPFYSLKDGRKPPETCAILSKASVNSVSSPWNRSNLETSHRSPANALSLFSAKSRTPFAQIVALALIFYYLSKYWRYQTRTFLRIRHQICSINQQFIDLTFLTLFLTPRKESLNHSLFSKPICILPSSRSHLYTFPFFLKSTCKHDV